MSAIEHPNRNGSLFYNLTELETWYGYTAG
jgi:hypothetical protein